jgi:bifunctional DNA-binding transcriptional regulator/antitoxin component of YhaV-PrlF toxin-antitoxin module
MAGEQGSRVIQPMVEGQIVIPDSMRHALGLGASELLEIRLDGEHLIISKLGEPSDGDIRVYTDEEIAEFLEADKIPPDLADWARRRFGRRDE